MGASASKSDESASDESPMAHARSALEAMPRPSQDDMRRLLQYPAGLVLLNNNKGVWRPDALTKISCLNEKAASPDSVNAMRRFEAALALKRHGSAEEDAESVDQREILALGVFFGMICGDALGSPVEFMRVRYDVDEDDPLFIQGFDDALWAHAGRLGGNKFGLQPGQWTDDASMGQVLAESLLVHGRLAARDLRLRFLCWWELGYCNAFGYDEVRLHGGSVGLGGNVGSSFVEFREQKTRLTRAGTLKTSGNGSLMRCAAVPVFFARAPKNETADDRKMRYERAMRLAYYQSKTTHQGDESAEACRLLTYIVLGCIDANVCGQDPRSVLGTLPGAFESPLYSVQCLAASRSEERHPSNASTPDLADRNWQWRADEYRYSPTRAKQMPGYIGSYAMDGLAMALHCAWTTDSLESAMLKCANHRGDADTVTAICGQIVGAMYGYNAIPQDWLARIFHWDPKHLTLMRAHELYHKEREEEEERFDTSEDGEMGEGDGGYGGDGSGGDSLEDDAYLDEATIEI